MRRLREEIRLTWLELIPMLEALLTGSIALLVAIWICRLFWIGWD